MIQLYVRCMMKKLSKTLLMSPAVSLVLPAAFFVSFNSAYASLVDTSQNQTFESRPQAAASSKRPVSSPFIKLAAVHFIANDGNLSFGNQEFLPEDICKQGVASLFADVFRQKLLFADVFRQSGVSA